jgi:putative copper resistance protein D
LSPSQWEAAAIGVKTLVYAATLGAAGAVFFLGYSGRLIAGAQRLAIRRLCVNFAVLSTAAGIAQIMVTAGSMSGAADGMWNGSLIHMVLQAGPGRSVAIRTAGLVLAAAGIRPQRPAWWALLGAAAAATSFAWTGHAHSLASPAIPVLLVGIHLLGVAFWLGALMPLAIVARGDDPAGIAAAATRFSAAAMVVVAGLIGAAAPLLWLLLGGFADIGGSPYGRWFILKLTLVAGLLGAAAFNKWRLTPRLRTGDRIAVRGLRASLRLEMLLGILILAVTATVTTVAGPPALD